MILSEEEAFFQADGTEFVSYYMNKSSPYEV